MASNLAPQLRPYHFQKGKSGNPSGKRKNPPEYLAHIKAFSAVEISHIIAKYGRMILDELVDYLEDRNTPVVEKCIAKMFLESIKEADFQRLSFLLDRCIGKPHTVEIDWEDDAHEEQLSKIPLQDLLQLVKNAIPEMSKKVNNVD